MNYNNALLLYLQTSTQLKPAVFLTVSTILKGNVGYLDYDFKIVLFGYLVTFIA